MNVSVEEVVDAINTPVEKWPSNCHGIAMLLLESSLVAGIPRYGHYRGYIASDSRFANRRHVGWIHHGWIELDNGEVCDPTRFVFEGADPYIYFGPGDEYDHGGDVSRKQLEKPFPEASEEELGVGLDIDMDTGRFLRELTGSFQQSFSVVQIFWMANLSRSTLGTFAPQVYEALAEAGFEAAIPIDNWEYYFGKKGDE